MNVPYRNEEESDKINEYLVSFGLLYCLILLRGALAYKDLSRFPATESNNDLQSNNG